MLRKVMMCFGWPLAHILVGRLDDGRLAFLCGLMQTFILFLVGLFLAGFLLGRL